MLEGLYSGHVLWAAIFHVSVAAPLWWSLLCWNLPRCECTHFHSLPTRYWGCVIPFCRGQMQKPENWAEEICFGWRVELPTSLSSPLESRYLTESEPCCSNKHLVLVETWPWYCIRGDFPRGIATTGTSWRQLQPADAQGLARSYGGIVWWRHKKIHPEPSWERNSAGFTEASLLFLWSLSFFPVLSLLAPSFLNAWLCNLSSGEGVNNFFLVCDINSLNTL